MSDVELEELRKGIQTLPGRPLGQAESAPFRVSQILSTDGLQETPPVVWIGDPANPTEVRVMGRAWDYHPGDTVLYQHRDGLSIIVGKLANVGTESDPTEDDYPAWTSLSLSNSWVWWGSPHATPAYYQQSDGWVRVKGLVKNGTATVGTVVATGLPQPAHSLYFTAKDAATCCVLEVTTTGTLVIRAAAANNSFLSFAGITYPSANNYDLHWDSDWKFNRAYWEVPLFQTGFNKAAVTESEIEVFVRSDGWCWMKGVLETATVPGKALDMPDRAAPGWLCTVQTAFGFGLSRIDIGGGDPSSNRGPTTMRVESGGGSGQDHYLGGSNWWGRGSQGLSHFPVGTDDVDTFGSPPGAFENGWTNFGSDFMTCRFKKDVHGIVHLMGLAQGSSSTADVIFTLPVGFRPLETHVFKALFNNSGNTGRVDVDASGVVTAVAHPNNTWCTLDGITFRAEQ